MSKNGIIWILGDSYLCSFNGEKVNYYESDSLNIFSGNSGLLPLDDGNVLFGGSGLRMLIVENSSFKFKTLDSVGWVNGIAYTKDGNIIYSNANELIVMKDFKKIGANNQENGFIFDVPTTVFIDHRGWIWSAHESGGVGYYNGNIWSFINTDDGLHSNQIDQIIHNNLQEFYFINRKGYTKYIPNKNAGVVSIGEIGTSKNNYNKLKNTNI